MFDFLKPKKKVYTIGSPVVGKMIPIGKVADETFSSCVLGKSMAVIPHEGQVFAPCDGEITMVFDTLHAIGMTSEFGAELLIHIGLDTVTLKGAPFTAHIKTGDKVKKGDLLVEVDLGQIAAAGLDPVIPVIVCNTDAFASVEEIEPGREVAVGNEVLRFTAK